MTRLFVSAGDISGDQHAARMLDRLRVRISDLEVEGLGGPALAAAGCHLHTDLVGSAIIGFSAAIKAIPELFGLLRRVAGILDARRPDALVLVDYPGLNLFLARMAHRRGIPVVYFVAPQLWAWAPWRVRRFARVVDEAYVIFPFEEDFFRAAGVPATWIGHPVLDGLPDTAPLREEISSRPLPLALLPGSRPREVRHHGPVMLETARRLQDTHPELSLHTAHVSAAERDNLAAMAAERDMDLHVHGDDIHGVMASCHTAIVASGTATLETAMLGTPHVVMYSITPFERRLRDWLLIPEVIGQTNLLAGRELCPEIILLDEDPTPLEQATASVLDEGDTRAKIVEGIRALRARLEGAGACDRAAALLAERLGGR